MGRVHVDVFVSVTERRCEERYEGEARGCKADVSERSLLARAGAWHARRYCSRVTTYVHVTKRDQSNMSAMAALLGLLELAMQCRGDASKFVGRSVIYIQEEIAEAP